MGVKTYLFIVDDEGYCNFSIIGPSRVQRFLAVTDKISLSVIHGIRDICFSHCEGIDLQKRGRKSDER